MTSTAVAATANPPARAAALSLLPLERWLEVGDPLADAVFAELRRERVSLHDPVNDLRRLAADGSEPCRSFLRDVETPAPDADATAMRLGASMAYRHFLQLSAALVHGGLMTTFCSPDAAFLIAGSEQLERDVPGRLFRSAILFFGVLDVDELQPGGTAWESCVRVRLMHAMIRAHVQASSEWQRPGLPISALHTATGPLFFGTMVLDRLRLLGARISDQEAAGYLLLWRHVTRLLGVPDDIVGETDTEQAVLDARILPLSFDPDATSRRLARVLLDGLADMTPVAGNRSVRMHEALARVMLGDERADAMGIPRRSRHVRGVHAIGAALRMTGQLHRVPGVDRVFERLGRRGSAMLVARGQRDLRPATD